MKRENTSAGGRTGALPAVTETSAYGCFPAGTRILLADGSSKPIEQVTEGDRVASTDPDTGQPTTATVTRTLEPARHMASNSGQIPEGGEKFTDGSKEVHMRSPDRGAPEGSNSATGPTAIIRDLPNKTTLRTNGA